MKLTQATGLIDTEFRNEIELMSQVPLTLLLFKIKICSISICYKKKKIRPHANLVQFLGFGFLNEELVLVTEYCEGGSLFSVLRNKSEIIDRNLILKWCRGIAAGMSHLHSEGIIHRDLAARNILLSSDKLAKVSDFGMSRVSENEDYAKTESNVGPLVNQNKNFFYIF